MIIPENFEDWRTCIAVRCGIPLTKEFIDKRIALYQDEMLEETRRFVARYGEEHRLNVLQWFRQALESVG